MFHKSIVRKIWRPRLKRHAKDYYSLYRSRIPMVRRLADSEKKYLEGLYKKRVEPTATANSLLISIRHIKRL